jgi:hypothetical protein
MVLRSGYLFLAQRLQEASDAAPHSVIASHLQDAVRDAHKGTGNYAHYIDHTGDGKSGDVIYSVDGETKSMPYAITSTASKQTASVDKDKAEKVIPVVAYKKQATATQESQVTETSGLKLIESAACLETIVIREAKADYEIKLIAPGKGSSAFYPAEVLKRDGPEVFKAGTHVYVNHPTFAEESARPEGDVKNLAGVLTTAAAYHEAHAKGPGLYARMKVFADHGQMVEEKAAHVGMSIRASGVAESGKTKEGVPVLAKLTSAESVDVVTRAGAGGMILTEAARTADTTNTGDDMTDEDRKLLREAIRVQTEARARTVAVSSLSDVSLLEAGKSRVIDLALRNLPMKDGVLDEAKLDETVKAEAAREGAYLASLMGTGVRGMGLAPVRVELTEKEEKAQRKAAKRLQEASNSIFADLTGDPRAGALAAQGRAA